MTLPSEFRVEMVGDSDGAHGPRSAVVQVWGEVDIETSPMLVDVVQSATRPGVRIVVDLSTVEFIDSSGISALLVGASRARDGGATLVVHNPAPRVRRIFEVLALDGALLIEGIEPESRPLQA